MPPPSSVDLRPLPMSAAGDLLTVQRAAYVTEAQLYDDPWLPALQQTLEQVVEELTRSRCVSAWTGARLVGAVRTREEGRTLHIGRLVVVPDLQGRGLGSLLLAAAEEGTVLPQAALLTGSLSTGNLRLYRRHGYEESRREQLRPGIELVHLVKDLGPGGRG